MFLVFSRGIVGSGLEETELVVVELLCGGQRHCGPSQANSFGSVRVLASVRPDIIRQTVRLDSEHHQFETFVHQGRIVSRNDRVKRSNLSRKITKRLPPYLVL